MINLTQAEFNEYLLKKWTEQDYTISEFRDEYHSFHELYEQRKYLTALAFNSNPSKAWKSKQHDDGTMFEGYFIVGISTDLGQFTYHYKLDAWDIFKIPEIEAAPSWDGHTAAEVERLLHVNTN
jgi:hypothetical protein